MDGHPVFKSITFYLHSTFNSRSKTKAPQGNACENKVTDADIFCSENDDVTQLQKKQTSMGLLKLTISHHTHISQHVWSGAWAILSCELCCLFLKMCQTGKSNTFKKEELIWCNIINKNCEAMQGVAHGLLHSYLCFAHNHMSQRSPHQLLGLMDSFMNTKVTHANIGTWKCLHFFQTADKQKHYYRIHCLSTGFAFYKHL